jgi:hypothetical protein
VYPDERVARLIDENFIPVRIHIKEKPDQFQRFHVSWTPTQLIMDPDSTERYRIEGFLPVEDFLGQLELGLGRLLFEHEDYEAAERRFHAVCDDHPRAGAAPEACYWAGVAAYKAKHEPAPLRETALLLRERYPDSEWTRKASVWAA